MGGSLLGRGFPRLYRGRFVGSRKSSYKQNGDRVKDGRQAARRSGRPNGAGAGASRRRTVILAFFFCGGAADSAHPPWICTLEMRAPLRGGSLFGRVSPLQYRGVFGGRRKSPYEKNRGRVKDGRQAARRSGRPNGALLNGRCWGGQGERHTSPPTMYAADKGGRRCEVGVSPGFSADGLSESANPLTGKMVDRVKDGRQAARRISRPNGALLYVRCCGRRGECHTSPQDMYAANAGAPLGRGFPRLYRGGFGGCRKSPYNRNGGSGKGRVSSGPTQRPAELPLCGGALLYERFCGWRGGRRASPLNMYSEEEEGAAASRRGPVRSGFRPAVSRSVRRTPQIFLQAKWGVGYRKGANRFDAEAGRMEGEANAAHRPRIYTHRPEICAPQLRASPC